MHHTGILALFTVLALAAPTPAQQSDDPAIANWRRNLDGTTGTSEIPNINNVVSQIEADVQGIHFTTDSAYVEATGLPSHTVGPWNDGNPGMPGDQDAVYRIPRNPAVENGTKTDTPLGPIGVLINGVVIFNAKDAMSWNNRGIWWRNAIWFEGQGMDTGLGHPAQDQYHYHQHPTLLQQQVGDNGIDHSPILGFAFDGFPIYGPYGYANADGSGGVVRIQSSWQTRNITVRHTLPDGTVLSQNQWGPDVSATYPLGAFIEDYEFVSASGDLDEHNGRQCVTPEYPGGTYAYFATVDAAGESAYPYLIGPTYYGVVDTGNIGPGGGNVSIPPTADEYAPFAIYGHDFEVGSTAVVAFGDADPAATVWLGYSLAGLGPTPSPWGDLGLSDPMDSFGPVAANGAGQGSFSYLIPASLSGSTVYTQALMQSGTNFTLSNAARALVP